MAQLKASQRKRMAKKTFVFPKGTGPDKGKDQYPIPDRAHGANALARGKQNLSPSDFATLKRKVCAKFKDLPACQSDRMNRAIRRSAGRS